MAFFDFSTVRTRSGSRWLPVALSVLIVLQPTLIHADNPTGGQFAAGAGSISAAGSTLNVNTATDRSVLNWQSFNIGAGHTTNFNQPGVNSAVLNRVVTPNNPSGIYGNLNSNGNVYLVNPSGVLVGPSGMVNTNGFTASVLDIPNREFMQGGSLNFRGASRASVINQGTINTGSGGATLIGGQLVNEGTIRSHGGSINLVTGGSVRLDGGGTFTQADQGTIRNGISETADLIRNSGTVRATGALEVGGEVYLVSPGGRVMQDGLVAAQHQSRVPRLGAQPRRAAQPSETAITGAVISDAESANNALEQFPVAARHSLPGRQAVLPDSGKPDSSLPPRVVSRDSSEILDLSTANQRTVDSSRSGLTTPSDTRVPPLGVQPRRAAQPPEIAIAGASISNAESADNALEQFPVAARHSLPGRQGVLPDGQTVGGNITITGEHVVITGTVDASGALGGGTINIGGGFQGRDADIVNSQSTTVTADAVIRANATQIGEGGTVVLWSDGTTNFQGTISARGGYNKGVPRLGAQPRRAAQPPEIAMTDSSISDTGSANTAAQQFPIAARRSLPKRQGVPPRTSPIGSGGLVEVSGKQHLNFAGSVDTGGGDLLLDPFNYTIGATEAANIVTALGSNNVTIQTSQPDVGFGSVAGPADPGEPGDITINSNILWSDASSLTLLAHRDINFNASVQNDSATPGGDLNIVAGWDGTTPFNAATFLNADVTTTTLYGQDNGSGAGNIFLGNGTQASGIAVGSRSGQTNAFANNLNILGSNTTNNAFAQLGFQVTDAGAAFNVTGPINVRTMSDIIGTGGARELTYAQLGHVGADFAFDSTIEAAVDADIQIAAGRDIRFAASGPRAYGQLGHGGLSARGNHSGDIAITEAADISFTGGAGDFAYGQLGHGGSLALGNHSGDITITEAGDISFMGGAAARGYGQLGHGGGFAIGNHSGAITITKAGDISFTGVTGVSAYGQLGHGGFAAQGNRSGAITITEAGDISFTAGAGVSAYGQLGHGGDAAQGNHSGAITITEAGDISFTAGTGDDAYGQFGHGGYRADGNHSGAITITEAGDISFTAGTGTQAYGQLGHGGDDAHGNHSGAITITEAGDISFTAGAGDDTYGQLGHGGDAADGNHSGAITITQAGDISFTAGAGPQAYSQFGHGGYRADGNHGGLIDVTTSGNLTLAGQDTIDQYALLGHGDELGEGDAGRSVNGDIMLRIGGSATLTNAFIGHLIDPDGTYTSGDTFLGVRTDLTADATSQFFSADPSGELRFYVGGADNVHATALLNGIAHGATVFPNDHGTFAFGDGPYLDGSEINQVAGNFGYYDLADIFNYNVNAGEAANLVTALNGGTDVTLAFDLNQANFGAEYDWDGGTQFIDIHSNVLYDSQNDLNLLATGDVNLGASVQNANDTAGDLNIVAGWNGTTPFDAAAFLAFAVDDPAKPYAISSTQHDGNIFIGDGTQTTGIAVGSRSGQTNAMANNLNILGSNTTNNAFAQLGFQVSSAGAAFNVTGPINVRTMTDIIATGGTRLFAYAQLGHVGADFALDTTIEAAVNADIHIAAGRDINFMGGANTNTYGQLGHGGYAAHGNHGGDITITKAADVSFMAGADFSAYAQLGHGGGFALGSHNGDITITEAGDISFTSGGRFSYGQLGHGGYFARGNHSGDITITEAGDISFTAGAGTQAYGQLGHGGYFAQGNHSGDITINEAGDISFMAGADFIAYGQLGHGGAFADGNHGGLVDITTSGNLTLTGRDGAIRYVLLGHGDHPVDSDAGHSVNGDIMLRIGGSATLTNAFIGHLIGPDGTYTSGNTFIAIGQNDYAVTNTTDKLNTDAASRFFSAARADGGELRFYLPNHASWNANTSAELNGTLSGTATGSIPFVNEAGGFTAFNGGYVGTPVDNYSFYFSIVDLIVNALSGSSTYGDVPVDPGMQLVSGTLNTGDTLGSIGLTTNFNLTQTSDANTYILSVDDSGLSSSYRLVGSTNGTFTINPAALTITALDQLKPFQTTVILDGTAFDAIGLKNGDTIDSVTMTSDGSPASAPLGVYPIAVSDPVGATFNSANYDVTLSLDGSLLVTAIGTGMYTYDEIRRYQDYHRTVDSLTHEGNEGEINYGDPLIGGMQDYEPLSDEGDVSETAEEEEGDVYIRKAFRASMK